MSDDQKLYRYVVLYSDITVEAINPEEAARLAARKMRDNGFDCRVHQLVQMERPAESYSTFTIEGQTRKVGFV